MLEAGPLLSEFLMEGPTRPTPSSKKVNMTNALWIPPRILHAVLKISNISWDTSAEDIASLLNGDGPPLIDASHVHIPIDRLTGKTSSEIYVELPDALSVLFVVSRFNRKILNGRSLFLSPSSYQELCQAVFPSGGLPAKEELEGHARICLKYKLYFSRHCAERPFENIISILKLVPWYMLDAEYTADLFKLCLDSLSALKHHLEKKAATQSQSESQSGPSKLTWELFNRLLDASMDFPAFSMMHKQKLQVTFND